MVAKNCRMYTKLEKEAKKVKKGVAKKGSMWYYTQAPSAATKNDF